MSGDKAIEPTAVFEDVKIKTTCNESKYKWSDRQVELLISEWAREPCLYDTSHEEYSKFDKRLNVEKRIVAALNENVTSPEERLITVGDLKKKMNGLRTYHRTLWKKRNDLGAIEENTPSWQYYDQLMFLNNHFQPRETMATLPKRKLNMEETPDADGEQSEFEYTCNVNNQGPVTKSKRLWKPTHENEVIMKSMEYCKGKNPEMLFGELVGHSLTSIKDERNREYAKLQIQQILFKCRYPETDPRKFPQLSQLQSSVEQTNSPEL